LVANVKQLSSEPSTWRSGAEDIASASGTKRPGFESHQSIRLLGKHVSAVVYKKPTQYALCVERRNKGTGNKNIFKILKKNFHQNLTRPNNKIILGILGTFVEEIYFSRKKLDALHTNW
jgi:hypothetical protein